MKKKSEIKTGDKVKINNKYVGLKKYKKKTYAVIKTGITFNRECVWLQGIPYAIAADGVDKVEQFR